MRAHSVNFYLSVITITGFVLLGLIGINLVYEIKKVEAAFKKSHNDGAHNEMQRGLNNTLTKANDIIEDLIAWDETSQQLSDPTYYTYWRQTRVQNVKKIPSYVQAIELYRSDGSALLKPRDRLLPDNVPTTHSFTALENGRPWLCIFKPIPVQDQSENVLGYIGIKIDFISALLELNLFSHIDVSSINFLKHHRSTEIILPKNIINHIQISEVHSGELDQLKNVIYVTFSYIVGLAIVVLMLLSWMAMVMFAKPLTFLNQHIKSFERNPLFLKNTEELSTVHEINNLAASLMDYQYRLNDSQNTLKNLNNELEERVKDRTNELQVINNELEAFSYSVSHDLRAPLRSIDGFSQAVLEDYGDRLDDQGKDYLERVRLSAQRMAVLIDDLLKLSQITRIKFTTTLINLSDIAEKCLNHLAEQNPNRKVTFDVAPDIHTEGDQQLITILLDNLLNNAWKYASKNEHTFIEFGCEETDNERVFYVKDNGVGFDTQYETKMFEVFERLHGKDFEGTGIGLATVKRIIDRHQGRIWTEAEPGKGSTFFFTLSASNKPVK